MMSLLITPPVLCLALLTYCMQIYAMSILFECQQIILGATYKYFLVLIYHFINNMICKYLC